MSRPKFLFHNNFYDTALNGLAEYNGEKVWFTNSRWTEEEYEDHRPIMGKFPDGEIDDDLITLYILPPDLLKLIEKEHELFQQCVGFNCDHDPATYKPYRETGREDEFYNRTNKVPNINVESLEKIGCCWGYQIINKNTPHCN